MIRQHALVGLSTRPSLALGLSVRAVRTPALHRCARHHNFYTLGIETSCDDTCVSVLRTCKEGTFMVYLARVPCANKKYEGIHPLEAVESHTRNLPKLITEALTTTGTGFGSRFVPQRVNETVSPTRLAQVPRWLGRPDLIAVTRGPGMKACLSIGISAAKALSAALRVPLIGVHHMQAHALTAQMEAALSLARNGDKEPGPQFPFLTLLVSGGHTMLVHTTSKVDHRVLASTSRGTINPQEKASPTAIGDMLDKCARVILPDAVIPKNESVSYAQIMEAFVRRATRYHNLFRRYTAPERREDEIQIYNSKAGWAIPPPLRQSREMKYDFSGLGGMVRSIVQDRPDMGIEERAELGYQTMRLAFEHLGSRVIMALQEDEELLKNPPRHLVVSGGVASNRMLRTVLSEMLWARGFKDIQLTVPKTHWCTDNAGMIAWTGHEMYRDGWTTDSAFLPKGEWPIEQIIADTDCWIKSEPRLAEEAEEPNEQQVTSPPKAKAARAAPAAQKPHAAFNVPAAAEESNADEAEWTRMPRRRRSRASRRAFAAAQEEQAEQTSEAARLQEVEERVQKLQRVSAFLQRTAKRRGDGLEGPPPPPPPQEPAFAAASTTTTTTTTRKLRSRHPSRRGPPFPPPEHAQQPSTTWTPSGRHAPAEHTAGPFGHRPLGAPPVSSEPPRLMRKRGQAPKPEPKPEPKQEPKQEPQPDPAAAAAAAERMAQAELLAAEGQLGDEAWSKRSLTPPAGTPSRPDARLISSRIPRDRSARAARKNRAWGTRALRLGAADEGDEETKKKDVVRLLRPLEPAAEEAMSSPPADVGSLRKGFSALRKWAGL
ncbi:hypothetical protein VMCG_01349 [Cytospora schulzeri]|uniref:Gcp-like domain-containing protein n=1 Tax=Cytospora schulzeri TaxID=448051 RepID=A0A423X648_9PEZI|nr:hypothetical protein VMCG_01349 [Valsa malicola]